MTGPAGVGAAGDEELRAALAALTGYPADSRTVQAFMEVYREYAERHAREAAAEALEWAATEAECGHDLRMLNRRARAAALIEADR